MLIVIYLRWHCVSSQKCGKNNNNKYDFISVTIISVANIFYLATILCVVADMWQKNNNI